jgi:RNase P subunit RPR2
MVVDHDYIHVGNGAMYCQTCEVLVTEQDGAAAVRDMKEHEREATTMVVTCKNCGDPVYRYAYRWRHTNGLYTCTIQMPRPRPRATPREEDSHE